MPIRAYNEMLVGEKNKSESQIVMAQIRLTYMKGVAYLSKMTFTTIELKLI